MTDAAHPVLVVGAGPAGCACALALNARGRRTILAHRPGRRGRCLPETCSADVVERLASLSRQRPPTGVFRPLDGIASSWGTAELNTRSFRLWHGAPAALVDRVRLERWLLEAARASSIEIVGAVRRGSPREDGAGWSVELEVEPEYARHGSRPRPADQRRVGFVVDATGRAASADFHADATRRAFDALVCISTELDGQMAGEESSPMVTIEAAADGWWYAAPTSTGRWAVAHYLDALDVGRDAAATFRSRLGQTLHMCSRGTLAETTQVQTCDARTTARRVLWRRRWLAIGDAAWALDPLSGNGIARAVADGIGAADAITAFLGGDSLALQSYAATKATALRSSLFDRRDVYVIEQRFQTNSFWLKRR